MKIAITTGDKRGIGKEITKKALLKLNPAKDKVLIVGEDIGLDYETHVIKEADNGTFCYKSLELVSKLAKDKKIGAIVTSPVSKIELHKSGYKFGGQTEVLESFLAYDNQKAQMIFIADELKVMLLSRHCALKDIKFDIKDVVFQTKILQDFLIKKYKINSPRIALCAFNPHCGEGGILGREELDILNPAVDILRAQGVDITYPKSADGLFAKIGKEYLNKEKLSYDAILACYHDQGLCPVKALAFDKAVNTTIGLDIIRTSPSSGTAYDIANKGIADESGMVEAVKLAFKLAQ